jgi:hypothetical protein
MKRWRHLEIAGTAVLLVSDAASFIIVFCDRRRLFSHGRQQLT